MIQQRTIGSQTEIYVGGNFITQAYPTNFHEFYTRKIITPGDTVDNYREVTAAQKATIEAADAKWEKPGDWLIEQAEANGAIYNAATGYFELNGLIDITTEQMRAILAAGIITNSNLSVMYAFKRIRTHLPPNINIGIAKGSKTFLGSSVESVAANMLEPGTECFFNCEKLRSIKIYSQGESNNNAFLGCKSLESLAFYGASLRKDFSIQDSPLISMSSLEKIIKSSQSGDTAFTITLHPEAYARVTDEIFAAAAEKNITIATTA